MSHDESTASPPAAHPSPFGDPSENRVQQEIHLPPPPPLMPPDTMTPEEEAAFLREQDRVNEQLFAGIYEMQRRKPKPLRERLAEDPELRVLGQWLEQANLDPAAIAPSLLDPEAKELHAREQRDMRLQVALTFPSTALPAWDELEEDEKDGYRDAVRALMAATQAVHRRLLPGASEARRAQIEAAYKTERDGKTP